jgi:hypothetical protein
MFAPKYPQEEMKVTRRSGKSIQGLPYCRVRVLYRNLGSFLMMVR